MAQDLSMAQGVRFIGNAMYMNTRLGMPCINARSNSRRRGIQVQSEDKNYLVAGTNRP
jgi:hypothetical protein